MRKISGILLFGGNKHFFELGVMIALSSDIKVLMFTTGYSYLAPKGFLFSISPMFTLGLDGGDFNVLPAASLGYAF